MPASTSDILLYVIAIFIPPIPVFIKRGCGGQVCLNLILWILIWIPAVIHAFYIIATTPDVEHYEAVNMPSHYQNHPSNAPSAGHHAAPPPPQTQGFAQNTSYHGNGPPPPAAVGGPGRQEWDAPMHGQGQAPQNPAYIGSHPQQHQPQSYGAVAEPPSYHKQ